MKHKCSFIFKASTALVLALIMLFGTVATSIAAVVDELAATGWGTGDTWTVLNNVTDDWSTGSSCMSDGNDRYYVYYLKYADSGLDYNQLRFRFKAGSEVIGPGNGWYEVNATTNDNSHSGMTPPANNGNAYFYAPLNNNTKWQRVLVGANASGNYFWASVTNLNDLVATVNASSTTVNKNSSITLTGSCTGDFSSYYKDDGAGGKKAEYTYQYKKGTSGTWTDIKKNDIDGSGVGTDSTGTSFTPTSAGTYYVRVIVNDTNVIKNTNALGDRYDYSDEVAITVKETYSVTYNGNGNTGGTVPSTQTKVQGTNLTLATNSLTKTGYTANGWNTNSSGTGTHYNNGATYSTNAALNLFAQWTANTYTVTLNDNSGSGGSGTVTATYGSNLPSVTVPTRTGYTFGGYYSGDTQYINASGTGVKSWDKTSATTLTASWSEIKAGAKVAAYTNGTESGTGGKVKNGTGGTAVASFNLSSAFGISTKATVLAATPTAGYTFTGWETSGNNASHIIIYKNSDCTELYDKTTDGGTVTTVYVKSDGTSGMTNANAEIHALFVENKSNVSLKAYTNGSASGTGGSLEVDDASASSTIMLGVGTAVKLNATAASGYTFLGWTVEGADKSHVKLYTDSACTTAYTSGTTATIYVKVDSTTPATPDATIKAHFQSSTAHYITVYNNTLYDRAHWVVVSSPPQQVKVTNPTGTTKVYKYAAGTMAQRGEDNVSTTNNPATAIKNIVNTNNATYYEGNLLEVHEGDKVELIYSALASSDIITGVFYNNTIRYTTEKEIDNLFTERDYQGTTVDGDGKTVGAGEDDDVDFDYHDDTTNASASTTDGYALYANQYYYNTELAEVIAAQNYTATVDQDTHTVTWTVGNQDYLNIDMELNSKKEIHFSDTVNAQIHEVHTDNYYAVGEDVSPSTTETASLSIKAAGNSTQTNTITKDNIKFYYCNNLGQYINPVNGKVVSKANRVELKEGDATLTVVGSAASISNSGATASSAFYYIDGTMPATDVMVDLDISITYSLTMKSKIQYDGVNSKTAFLQVADLTLGTTTKTQNNDYNTSTTVTSSPATCTSGNSITFKADNITSGYMFVGWFLDKNGAPDLASEPLSRNATFSYKPTASVTVWAVGTRNLYINGSRYLFSGTRTDWQNDNVEMKYDSVKQLYYHEIDSTIFTAASSNFLTRENTNDWVGDNNNTGTGGNNYGYKESGGDYYWMSRTDSEHGNAYFQIINEPTGHSDNTKKTVWGGVYSFRTQANGITVGKAQRRGEADSNEDNRRNGQGFIDFSTSRYSGYDVPLRIYFNPVTSDLTAEATPIYPHIYVSNGYKNIDQATPSTVSISVNNGNARLNSCTNDSNYSQNMKFISNGWDPTYEGHVSDISVSARNATLTLSKTVSNTDYKVSNFLVYNMTKGTVKAHPATASGTTYTCNTIKTSDDDRLYIVPIVEYCGSAAKITINVDSTKLDYKKWGKLVSCYAWGSEGDACGAYPGQLMVPSDDGGSWTATFKAPSTLTGILFGNYVDASGSDGYTFISMPGIMGNVTYSGTGDSSGDPRIVSIAHSDYITQYNKISSGDYDKYTMANCKVQTYDYREPIAYLNNKPAGASNTTLTFALKDGNSNLLSRSHAQLKDVNILTLASTSNPSTPYTWSALKWEYLTDSSGDYYTDLNGFKLPEKPTASFYIAAKGMVKYKDNSMNTVFKTGKEYDSVTGVNYNDYYGKVDGEIDMNYAVQWYVYDAAGNYITDVLSAGFADKTDEGTDSTNYSTAMTVVTQRLLDLGYAVEGRSVKICYDKPRYCYWDNKTVAPNINNGDSFNVYRFTGQWYQDNEYRTAKVYAKVGIKTDNGEDIADASSAAYGSASVSVDSSKCSIAGYSGTDTEGDVDYGYTTIIDGDSGALTLTASATNFIGWYHYVTTYDSSSIEESATTQELVFDTAEPTFKPNYSKDVTYIAIYKAKVNYRYKYVGREGGTKYYNVPGSSDDNVDNMSAAEIANGNKVAIDDTHLTNARNNSPGQGAVSIFKKDVNFSTPSSSNFSNELEYVLTVDNFSKLVASYTLTVRYHNGSGWRTEDINVQYNTAIDLTARHSGVALTGLWSGHNFIGWYEYNNDTVGNLLSSQANYGMVMVKDQTITAVYEGDETNTTAPAENDEWQVFVDDHGPTYEKTSATAGTVYTDAIVRVRKNRNNVTTLDENARVGYLIVDDNGTEKTIETSKLKNYAKALQSASGKTGNAKVTVSGQSYTLKVTNLYTTSVNTFGRADLAAKSSLASVSGHRYYIYAYYYDGKGLDNVDNYHFNTTPVTGTY